VACRREPGDPVIRPGPSAVRAYLQQNGAPRCKPSSIPPAAGSAPSGACAAGTGTPPRPATAAEIAASILGDYTADWDADERAALIAWLGGTAVALASLAFWNYQESCDRAARRRPRGVLATITVRPADRGEVTP
jgi:hypothetical protein